MGQQRLPLYLIYRGRSGCSPASHHLPRKAGCATGRLMPCSTRIAGSKREEHPLHRSPNSMTSRTISLPLSTASGVPIRMILRGWPSGTSWLM